MSTYLMHHGIKGQRWGVRRFENPDGTLTEAGKKRYSYGKEYYDDDKVRGLRNGREGGILTSEKVDPDTLADGFRSYKTRSALNKSYRAYDNYRRWEKKAGVLADQIKRDIDYGSPNVRRSERLVKKGEKMLQKEAKLRSKFDNTMHKTVQSIKAETAKHGQDKVDFWMAKYGYQHSVVTVSDGQTYVIQTYHRDRHSNYKVINEVVRKHANED